MLIDFNGVYLNPSTVAGVIVATAANGDDYVVACTTGGDKLIIRPRSDESLDSLVARVVDTIQSAHNLADSKFTGTVINNLHAEQKAEEDAVPAPVSYPFLDGEFITIGPECFMGNGETMPDTVITYKGESYFKLKSPDYVELINAVIADGYGPSSYNPDSVEDAENFRHEQKRLLELAIGYDPVPLSIRNHPEIRSEFRAVAARDDLVNRILAAGFRAPTPNIFGGRDGEAARAEEEGVPDRAECYAGKGASEFDRNLFKDEPEVAAEPEPEPEPESEFMSVSVFSLDDFFEWLRQAKGASDIKGLDSESAEAVAAADDTFDDTDIFDQEEL